MEENVERVLRKWKTNVRYQLHIRNCVHPVTMKNIHMDLIDYNIPFTQGQKIINDWIRDLVLENAG